jgi:predicted metal-dependent hydrolase
MTEYHYTIQGPTGDAIPVTIRRDQRLRKTVRWGHEPDGSILIRVPKRYLKRNFQGLLEDVAKQLSKPKRRAKRRTDADLQRRVESINQAYFKGKIKWEAIRWVGNMQTRLGSCTNGGPTDGHIRISDKIKEWPDWVVDYVIAHEMTHRLHPDHSPEFWETLRQAYPKTEQARGFIKGVGFAKEWNLIEED